MHTNTAMHTPHAPITDRSEALEAVEIEEWEANYAKWIHLGSLIGYGAAVLTQGIAFPAPLIVAVVLWLIHKNDSDFLDDHGREAVNFQMSIFILFLLAFPVGLLTCGIGFLLIPATICLGVVGCIMGASAGKHGRYFRYPMTFRLL